MDITEINYCNKLVGKRVSTDKRGYVSDRIVGYEKVQRLNGENSLILFKTNTGTSFELEMYVITQLVDIGSANDSKGYSYTAF